MSDVCGMILNDLLQSAMFTAGALMLTAPFLGSAPARYACGPVATALLLAAGFPCVLASHPVSFCKGVWSACAYQPCCPGHVPAPGVVLHDAIVSPCCVLCPVYVPAPAVVLHDSCLCAFC